MTIKTADLNIAYDGSYYTILGAGGELAEWTEGYEKSMVKNGIAEDGKPIEWFKTTGASINAYAKPKRARDYFPDDLVVLMFKLDGLNVGKLAMFKMQMQDRWFDDVVDNIRA